MDFGELDNTFGSAPASAPGSGAFDDFGGAPPSNGLAMDDSLFTSDAQVYDSTPAAAYTPFDAVPSNPFDDAPANPPAAAYTSEPEEEDPRTVWYRKNAAVLAEKDQAEREAKKEITAKALQHLEGVYAARKVQLEAKRAANREAEVAASGTLPAGNTPWERVTSVIDFNFDAHKQDVSRYKGLLVTCKVNNVPVRQNTSHILPEPEAVPIL